MNEKTLLSTILSNAAATDYAIKKLSASDFQNKNCGNIFSAILDAKYKKLTPDIPAVMQILNERKARQETTDTLLDIATIASTINYTAITDNIKRDAERRRAISELRFHAELLEKEPAASIENSIFTLRTLTSTPSQVLTPRTRESIIDGITTRPDAIGTGFYIGGDELVFQSGALGIIAAPTNHGKTTMLINVACNIAESGVPVYFFSYEESSAAIDVKFISALHGKTVGSDNKRAVADHVKSSGKEYLAIAPTVDKYYNLIESGVLNIIQSDFDANALCSLILQIPHDRAVVIIDYIQLLYLDAERFTTRTEELKKIALMMKDVAIETAFPVICAAQFNREVTNPFKMTPQRLAESSDIEKAANKIVGLWNGCKKHEGSAEDFRKMSDLGIDYGVMYAEVLKARDEASGASDLFVFDGNIGHIGRAGSGIGTTLDATFKPKEAKRYAR